MQFRKRFPKYDVRDQYEDEPRGKLGKNMSETRANISRRKARETEEVSEAERMPPTNGKKR